MIRRIITTLLIFSICISLCACGAGSDNLAVEKDPISEEMVPTVLVKREAECSAGDYSYNEITEYLYDEKGVLLGYTTVHNEDSWQYSEETIVTFEKDGTKVEDTTRLDSGSEYHTKIITDAKGREILYQYYIPSFEYNDVFNRQDQPEKLYSFRETVYDDVTGYELSHTSRFNIGDEDESYYHFENEYDTKGRVIKQLTSAEDGSVEEYTLYSYDQNEFGTAYRYNAKDQLLDRTENFADGSKTYNAKDKLLRYTENEIDPNGNVVRSVDYDARGTIQYERLKEYDAANTLRKASFAGKNYSYVYEYNEYSDLMKYEYEYAGAEYTSHEICIYTYMTLQEYLALQQR